MTQIVNCYLLAKCLKCGSTHFVNGECQGCAIRALQDEVGRLKDRPVAVKTACDPDVGWGGD